MQVLQSRKKNFNETRLVDVPNRELNDGDIRVQIERFSFTANNATYAVLGDYLKYWQFFPATTETGEDDSDEWGIIPVRGFARVTESHCNEVEVGDRFFGYFPPAQYWIMHPSNVARGSFIDASEHRKALPAGYNLYRAAKQSDEQADNEQSLLFPLFVTSFCIHDLLTERQWLKAEQVLIISASSKTSIGLAYAMHDDEHAPSAVGLTSERNKADVIKLGLYDDVFSYSELDQLDRNKTTVIIDMSGNKTVLSTLHQHLADNMVLTLNVGITHWADLENVDGINNEACEQFFAPSHIQSIIESEGAQAFQAKSGEFVQSTAIRTRSWLQFKELQGLNQLQMIYQDVMLGNLSANKGVIVSLES